MNQIMEAALKLKDKILGYSIEQALEEATADTDNLNIPTRVLFYIADQSYNSEAFDTIVKHVWFQLSSPPEKWRRILKALNLIEFLLKNGSTQFEGEFRSEIFHIRMLMRFSHKENRSEVGQPVIDASFRLERLLSEASLLQEERKKAEESRHKLKAFLTNTTNSMGGKEGSSSTNRYEGFSSKEAEVYLKMSNGEKENVNKEEKIEGSTPVNFKDVNDKENFTPEGDFILRSNKIYTLDLTKEESPVKSAGLNVVDDLLNFQPTSTDNTKQPLKVDIVNIQENKASNEQIWSWDQPVYNKYEKTNEPKDFDWSQAPTEQATSENILSNAYNRSQKPDENEFDFEAVSKTPEANTISNTFSFDFNGEMKNETKQEREFPFDEQEEESNTTYSLAQEINLLNL